MEKNALRDTLRSKIIEKRISRSNTKIKNYVLEKTFKDLGIDKERYINDMEELKKQEMLKKQEVLKTKQKNKK